MRHGGGSASRLTFLIFCNRLRRARGSRELFDPEYRGEQQQVDQQRHDYINTHTRPVQQANTSCEGLGNDAGVNSAAHVEVGIDPHEARLDRRHLGVRILGEVRKEFADTLRLADDIFISELRANNLYDKVSQAFVVFLPVKSVGVTGDGRRYNHVVSLRTVETIDFMTARWAHLPYDFLDHVSRRIMNEIDGISRVVYDISGKPPGTIEWE